MNFILVLSSVCFAHPGINVRSGDTDLSDVFDISKADIQGDANEILMEAFEKIADIYDEEARGLSQFNEYY